MARESRVGLATLEHRIASSRPLFDSSTMTDSPESEQILSPQRRATLSDAGGPLAHPDAERILKSGCKDAPLMYESPWQFLLASEQPRAHSPSSQPACNGHMKMLNLKLCSVI
jgi:hypothetical protein